jgi:hypothetical protein
MDFWLTVGKILIISKKTATIPFLGLADNLSGDLVGVLLDVFADLRHDAAVVLVLDEDELAVVDDGAHGAVVVLRVGDGLHAEAVAQTVQDALAVRPRHLHLSVHDHRPKTDKIAQSHMLLSISVKKDQRIFTPI